MSKSLNVLAVPDKELKVVSNGLNNTARKLHFPVSYTTQTLDF
jgi:hypothetical protein